MTKSTSGSSRAASPSPGTPPLELPEASALAGLQPPMKASEAAPVLTNAGSIELENMVDEASRTEGGGQLDNTEDIMQLARLGDVAGMERLFETGKFHAKICDSEGVTPLHWAAINNQYAMCQFLLNHGADVDATGGTSISTPLQWAVQTGHYYTVHLLLQHGADPLLVDGQGYNSLHISTFTGNVLLLVMLLHLEIPVDVLDKFGHTGLMWSAYKGSPALVDVFLRWGADVHLADAQGFTALHWSLVKGNSGCVLKLVEYGSDRFARTHQGNTPASTAEEQQCEAVWYHALAECGYNKNGHPAVSEWPGLSRLMKDPSLTTKRVLFLWPFLVVWIMVSLIAYLPIAYGIPLSLLAGWGLVWMARKAVQFAPPTMKQFQKTPWLAGIFSGSLALVGINWALVILPQTILTSPLITSLNILFGFLYVNVVYFYASTMRADPGFVPKLNGIAEQKKVIEHLLSVWKFDETNFCVHCMIRRPLRSKHCGKCRRCVAKHDHHCPWVFNCIGINNHRHFFLYIITLTFGIVIHDILLYYYFQLFAPFASESCNILSAQLCQIVNTDTYTLILGIWITLQLSWVIMVIFVQLVQISRAMTTYENMRGVDDLNPSAATSSTGVALGHASLSRHGHSHGHGYGHGPRRHQHSGYFRNMARLLGVEPFIETIRGTGAATGKRQSKRNAFSRGCLTNCRDFWCDPAPICGTREPGSAILGGEPINYTSLYESPSMMDSRRRTTRGDGYEAVPATEV